MTPTDTSNNLINETKKAETTPNKITEPANLNILLPTPSTTPSDLCSMAAEMTALPKPVTGTALPAPANCPSFRYRPNPVKSMAINTIVATVGLPTVFSVKSKKIDLPARGLSRFMHRPEKYEFPEFDLYKEVEFQALDASGNIVGTQIHKM